MTNKFQSVRGMRDIHGDDMRVWTKLRRVLEETVEAFGYEPIHLPLLEPTALFSRGVGEATDIVEKEMYSLEDRDGDSLTLRPEGTAGCVRALLQHGLLHNQEQRVYYGGPMFRYERPQKGRYRQFEQIGVEGFGMAGPDIDAELIQIGHMMWQAAGLDGVRLEINTLGSGDARRAYRQALVDYLTPYAAELDEDSRRRLGTNPLRILDSKKAQTQKLVAGAPVLVDFIDAQARDHFQKLCVMLDDLGIDYTHNPTLVRGLDYYTHTVFEWMTDALGAQGTICAGGRYDRLVELLGGRATPGVGFALGLDRVALLAQTIDGNARTGAIDVYCCVMDESSAAWALQRMATLRRQVPGLRIRTHAGGGKLKNQMKRADQSDARIALVIGEDEIRDERVSVKWLREAREQERLALDELVLELRRL